MNRWKIIEKSKSIAWDISDAHQDDIEMSGQKISTIVIYGMDENGELILTFHHSFPTLRNKPNDTYATYQVAMGYKQGDFPRLTVNGELVNEIPYRAEIDGTFILKTKCSSLDIEHHCFPSTTLRAAYDIITVKNTSEETLELSTSFPKTRIHNETRGCMGINVAEVSHTMDSPVLLKPCESFSFAVTFTGRLVSETRDESDPESELICRRKMVERLKAPLSLDTGNDILDTEFAFAKIRAGESIFDTKGGLLHSPGGYSYLAAIWCNDEVEYAGPWASLTGDDILISAAFNAYCKFIPFMSESYSPIPSSIIAEGVDFWDSAGDRGDAAMYLYGASAFAMTSGDEKKCTTPSSRYRMVRRILPPSNKRRGGHTFRHG